MELVLRIVILVASWTPGVMPALIDPQATAETKALYDVLRSVAHNQSRILFGSHQPTLFGLYGGHPPYFTYEFEGKKQAWMYNPAEVQYKYPDELCDPCALVEDFPAVVGFDFGMVGSDVEELMVYLLQRAHHRGAIITFSYHAHNLVTGKDPWIRGDNASYHAVKRVLPGGDHYENFTAKFDQIADFIKTKVVDTTGRPIPIIFRPWHEANGGWFWWGYHNVANNTVDDIKQLYQNTVTYLKDKKGVHNIVWEMSPDCGGGIDGVEIYPDNDYIDILAEDCYLTPHRNATFLQQSMEAVIERAEASGKMAALAETGVIMGPLTTYPHFFTHDMLQSLTSLPSGMRVAYMLTWNNQRMAGGKFNLFNPVPGHPLAEDYVDFYKDSRTVYLSDLKSYYPPL